MDKKDEREVLMDEIRRLLPNASLSELRVLYWYLIAI